MGDYAVVARRSASSWYIALLNAGEKKEIEIDLASLVDTHRCKATLYSQPSEKAQEKIAVRQFNQLPERLSVSILKNSGGVLHLHP